VKTPRENELSSHVAVENVLNENQSIWQVVPAILAAYNALKTHIKAIQDFATAHKRSTKGVTATKRLRRIAMTDTTVEVAGGVRAYASAKSDEELLAKVALLPSDYFRARDTEVAGLCQGVHDAANAIVGSLADQGVTADGLKDLPDKIDEYSETVGKPRSAASNNRAAGKLADAEFEAAEKLLVEQLDGLILKFKTSQPAFYNAYRSARETVNNAAGHNGKNGGKSSTGHDTPPPPQ